MQKNSTPLFRCLVLQSMQSLWQTCSDEWWRRDVCHVLSNAQWSQSLHKDVNYCNQNTITITHITPCSAEQNSQISSHSIPSLSVKHTLLSCSAKKSKIKESKQVYQPVGRDDKPPPLARDCCTVSNSGAPSGECKWSMDVGNRQTESYHHHLKPPFHHVRRN